MELAYTVVNGKIVYNDGGAVEKKMLYKVNRGDVLHFALLDTEKKYSNLTLEDIVVNLCDFGIDVLLIGGSTGVTDEGITKITDIKERNGIDVPTIVFPRSVGDLKGRANAVLYMRCTNSRKMKYVKDEAIEGAAYLLNGNIEEIPLTYLIVEPGGMVGQIADAQLIPRDNPKIAIMHAREAKANGSRWFYLEAGSHASPAIHEERGPELISAVKKYVNLPLIVGGGIRSPEAVRIVKKAGANGIVTGNIIEKEDMSLMKRIIEAVHEERAPGEN
ncbi:MAG: phosphoglycerol geranylgeranyltransferase [Candidatus Woesearchaeota archaeon]|nr:MAG: phosphoglycerol geranylgeranyltransferase [Candidatus Woesearchaeota archaeon]